MRINQYIHEYRVVTKAISGCKVRLNHPRDEMLVSIVRVCGLNSDGKVCPFCGREFTTKNALYVHIYRYHQLEIKYILDRIRWVISEARKNSVKLGKLRRGKYYKCTICLKKFRRLSDLVIHYIVEHLNKKVF